MTLIKLIKLLSLSLIYKMRSIHTVLTLRVVVRIKRDLLRVACVVGCLAHE